MTATIIHTTRWQPRIERPYCEVGKRTNLRNFELEGRIIAERRRRAAAEQGEAW